jgi:hypothetical protein
LLHCFWLQTELTDRSLQLPMFTIQAQSLGRKWIAVENDDADVAHSVNVFRLIGGGTS